MRLVPFLPHAADDVLNVTGFHGTGMPRLMRPVRVALSPVFRQLRLKSIGIHLLVDNRTHNTDHW